MQDDNGSALLVAIGILAVLLLIAASILSLTYTESFISSHHAKNVQAWYAAEAGLEYAEALMAMDPTALENSSVDFTMGLNSGKVQGSTKVRVNRPEIDGLIMVRSAAVLSNGSQKILQASYTAPPYYVVYSNTVTFNQTVDIAEVMNEYAIEALPAMEVPAVLNGSLTVDPFSRGAYQFFGNDLLYFVNHSHCYKAPTPNIPFYRKLADFADDLEWRDYAYDFREDSQIWAGDLDHKIWSSANDLVIYTVEPELRLNEVMLVAGRDIWVVNLGSGPTLIKGHLLAGRNINLYQLNDRFEVIGALLATDEVNLYSARGEMNLVYDPQFMKGLPDVLKGKTGYLTLKSLKEVY